MHVLSLFFSYLFLNNRAWEKAYFIDKDEVWYVKKFEKEREKTKYHWGYPAIFSLSLLRRDLKFFPPAIATSSFIFFNVLKVEVSALEDSNILSFQKVQQLSTMSDF